MFHGVLLSALSSIGSTWTPKVVRGYGGRDIDAWRHYWDDCRFLGKFCVKVLYSAYRFGFPAICTILEESGVWCATRAVRRCFHGGAHDCNMIICAQFQRQLNHRYEQAYIDRSKHAYYMCVAPSCLGQSAEVTLHFYRLSVCKTSRGAHVPSSGSPRVLIGSEISVLLDKQGKSRAVAGRP